GPLHARRCRAVRRADRARPARRRRRGHRGERRFRARRAARRGAHGRRGRPRDERPAPPAQRRAAGCRPRSAARAAVRPSPRPRRGVMTRPAANWRLHRRVLMQARPYWLHVAAILVLGLLAVPLALMVPLPLKIAVDSVIGNRPVPGWVDWLAPDAL